MYRLENITLHAKTPMKNRRFACATRFFVQDVSRIEADRLKIGNYVSACLRCDAIETLYIAVDPDRDRADSADHLRTLPIPDGKRLVVLPVTPWGRYVEALNALIMQAAFDGYDAMLFANTEHTPSNQNVSELASHLDSSTLVVGAALDVFHQFDPGHELPMNGVRVPSDAFMLVNLTLLSLFGFISVSEAPWIPRGSSAVGTPSDPGMLAAGIKEVASFSLIQHILGREKARVKLLRVTGAERDTSSILGERKVLDDHKRKSAIQRAEEQLFRTGIPTGIVAHI